VKLNLEEEKKVEVAKELPPKILPRQNGRQNLESMNTQILAAHKKYSK
jgi:hypothetical protein